MVIEAVGREARDAQQGFCYCGSPGSDVTLLGFFIEEGVGAEDVGAETDWNTQTSDGLAKTQNAFWRTW